MKNFTGFLDYRLVCEMAPTLKDVPSLDIGQLGSPNLRLLFFSKSASNLWLFGVFCDCLTGDSKFFAVKVEEKGVLSMICILRTHSASDDLK